MKIVDESILFFSRISLSKFFLEALYNTWVQGVFILVCVSGMRKVSFSQTEWSSDLTLPLD